MPPCQLYLLRHLRASLPHHSPLSAARSRPQCFKTVPYRVRQPSFHTYAHLQADSQTLPNHYETLQLPHTASPADIKRQFFTLSKEHHPDRNPDDPTASTRFVAISEAYHVLSVPDKRVQYDLQLSAQQGSSRWGRSEVPKGSYSSASFAGSRAATGLNKKRGTFRGPPPSFYKAGGYGKHHAKRSEYAHENAPGAGGEAGQEFGSSYRSHGGYGPGQTEQGRAVPHFDDVRHKRMHDNVNEHINARREKARERASQRVREEIHRGGTLTNFFMVSGILVVIGVSMELLKEHHAPVKRKQEKV
ncbi:DnaJ-domain-containing protein [Lojkania enalia]|uniref:DnaJ-domain-containing protein n=1 Tax=Lojkania enalia TaxID=147567 RepID=A0A9P4N274_9PLEO|nr:DnaJ-domain-containing protein [Didymosphaeria enalia]